jgi:predicted ATP-grasp superfamily ATP-dependent carboligase
MNKRHNRRRFPAAIILGMSITGLHTIRSLGRYDIFVTGIDYDSTKIAFLSRYCHKLICPHPRRMENQFIEFLVSLGEKLESKAVLIPTNDEFLISISRNRHKLNRNFLYNLPSNETIEKLNNKEDLYHLAKKYNYAVPKTYSPNGISTVEKIGQKIDYPCIIKMKYGYYYQDTGFKVIKIHSEDKLIKIYYKLAKNMNDIMIQEIIPGNADQQYSLYSYISEDSSTLASMTSRKLRQLPIEFGVGTLVETIDEPIIQEIGLSFLKKINYQGLSEIEFKKDSRDNQYKIIEVNTRPWIQINLARRCGVDFCLLSYMDVIGKRVSTDENLKSGVKWLCLETDVYASFGSSGYIRNGLMTPMNWISSLKGEKEYAYFALDDLKPFLRKLLDFMKNIFFGFNKYVIYKGQNGIKDKPKLTFQ